MRRLVLIGELDPYLREARGRRARRTRRLLEQADRYARMALPERHPRESTTYMGIAIINLALAYLVSGEERYLRDARRFMRCVLSYEKWGNAHLVNVDLSASWILFGLSLGYDWLKPYLAAEEREQIARKIRHHARIIFEHRRGTYGDGWSTHFFQNHNWINMTGLAAAGYALMGEADEAESYTREAKENFARVFSYLPDDGSNYEGVTYWRYGGMWLFVYAHLLKVQEGDDWFARSGYLKNTFYYRLYQSCGDLKQQMNFGDCHDRYSGHTACVYYKAAAEYGDGYAQTLGDLVTGEFLMEEAANSKVKPGILPEAAFEFLWYEPDVAARPLDELPLTRYFADLGLLYVRSSWARDAKVLTIKCGYPGGKSQWEAGWRIYREEGLRCFSLSHHHPDNLSYIFARGGEYLTCEDGYNRNLMPDNHNVLLVDGMLLDASDVEDAYMSSVEKRRQAGAFDPAAYGGRVSAMERRGSLILFRGETSGVYPTACRMREASRLLITDGLAFWAFVDVLRSEEEHAYTVLSNTTMEARPCGDGFFYPMRSGGVYYRVFSNHAFDARPYAQHITSVMTTQEPDKVCVTDICTLSLTSRERRREQVFYECFTFDWEDTRVAFDGGALTIRSGRKVYELGAKPWDERLGRTPIEVRVRDARGEEAWLL